MADPTEIGERAFTAAQNLLKRGQHVAKREARVLRLQSQISKLKSQRVRLLSEMGKKVFELFEKDLVKNQDLRMMCQQIRGVDAEISLKREEVEQLRRDQSNGEAGVEPEPRPDIAILDEDDVQ
jgi:predicted RNase H-like nuclease (RuvC/YqgF family)